MAKGNIQSTLSVLKTSQDNNVININQVGVPVSHMLSINVSSTILALDVSPPANLPNAKLVQLNLESQDNDILVSHLSTGLTVNTNATFSGCNSWILKGGRNVDITYALEKVYVRRKTLTAKLNVTGIFDLIDESSADYESTK